jgi:hypothetical protein
MWLASANAAARGDRRRVDEHVAHERERDRIPKPMLMAALGDPKQMSPSAGRERKEEPGRAGKVNQPRAPPGPAAGPPTKPDAW